MGLTFFESLWTCKLINSACESSHPIVSFVENGETIHCQPGFEKEQTTTFKGMKTIPEILKSVLESNKDKEILGYREILNEDIVNDENGKCKVLLEPGPYK
ncbi:hypothetical protein RF11_11999 [Thelohanellus kitauei]|uniref:Uncharacterized protein n=1 Tax=Thelohanellus kitauei TaxID=669202 RepID=A0A0C2MG90_THEKT|nr:hypothetical protein RF11_11999 [Thelohanellus kitauei]